MFIQDIKNEEFMKNVEKLKDLDFAESLVLQTLFEYKLRDEHDQIDLASEIAKEYHYGKLDPKAGYQIKKKKILKKSTGMWLLLIFLLNQTSLSRISFATTYFKYSLNFPCVIMFESRSKSSLCNSC